MSDFCIIRAKTEGRKQLSWYGQIHLTLFRCKWHKHDSVDLPFFLSSSLSCLILCTGVKISASFWTSPIKFENNLTVTPHWLDVCISWWSFLFKRYAAIRTYRHCYYEQQDDSKFSVSSTLMNEKWRLSLPSLSVIYSSPSVSLFLCVLLHESGFMLINPPHVYINRFSSLTDLISNLELINQSLPFSILIQYTL